MISTPALLATLAALLTLGNASPLPNNDGHLIPVAVAPNPTTGGRPIKWLDPYGKELCLQVNAVSYAEQSDPNPVFNGATLGIGLECFGGEGDFAALQQWVYQTGSTKICLAPNSFSDLEYCIDFGTNLGANGQPLKIWQAYDVPQQQLYITDDNHIAVENGPNQCADVQAESITRPARGGLPYGTFKDVQSYQCTYLNTNQIFIFDSPPPPPPPPPPPAKGKQIKWLRQEDKAELCLQIDSRTGSLQEQLRNGAPLTIGECFADDSQFAPFQRFDYTLGSTKICVSPNQYSDTQYCIDFGTNLGSSGQTLYIWQAYPVPQQQLYITDDNHIAVEGGNQCADVKAESGPQPAYARPYGSLKDVQSWQCTQYNTNQIFIFTP